MFLGQAIYVLGPLNLAYQAVGLVKDSRKPFCRVKYSPLDLN